MGTVKISPKTVKWYLESQLKIKLTEEYKFHPKRKWRADLACLEHNILIEIEGGVYQGGRHTRPLGYIGDIEKYNNATALGYKVLRIATGQSLSDFGYLVQQTIDLK